MTPEKAFEKLEEIYIILCTFESAETTYETDLELEKVCEHISNAIHKLSYILTKIK